MTATPDVDQRVLFGQSGQRGEQRRGLLGPDRPHHALQARRREHAFARAAGGAEPVADPDVPQAAQPGDVAGERHLVPGDLDRRDATGELGFAAVERDPLSRRQRAGVQPGVGDLLTGAAAVDLEHRRGERPVAGSLGGREQLGHRFDEVRDAGAGDRRAGQHGVQRAAGDLPGQLAAAGRGVDPVVHIGLQERVVAVGQQLGQLVGRRSGVQRDRPRRQLRADVVEQVTRARPVGLVHEDQRRDAEAAQRPHQHAGLGLDAFDGGHHEDGAVEHPQRAFDLGDEVGVARGVDQRDPGAAGHEGGHRGADGDAATAFEVQGVGLGVAAVDAAEPGDGAGLEEQALGQAGLTGVDVRENADVQGFHGCGRSSGMRWTGRVGRSVGASGLLAVVDAGQAEDSPRRARAKPVFRPPSSLSVPCRSPSGASITGAGCPTLGRVS